MYIVINGGGKVGEYLATVLLQSGNEVAVIEQDPAVADRLSMLLQGRYLVIRGDGCNSKYLEDAGIRKADVFVAALCKRDSFAITTTPSIVATMSLLLTFSFAASSSACASAKSMLSERIAASFSLIAFLSSAMV